MVVSPSRISYLDCFELLDQALEDPKGVRIQFDDWKSANYFRMRLHTARKIDRQDNARTYEEGEPMHGRSIYDTIVGRIYEDTTGKAWLYLEVRNTKGMVVEKLSELGDEA